MKHALHHPRGVFALVLGWTFSIPVPSFAIPVEPESSGTVVDRVPVGPPTATTRFMETMDLRVPLPVDVEQVELDDPRSSFFRDREHDWIWFVEVKGQGTFPPPPDLGPLLALVAENMGGTSVPVAETTQIGEIQGVLAAFDADEERLAMCLGWRNGYLYMLGASAPAGLDAQLTEIVGRTCSASQFTSDARDIDTTTDGLTRMGVSIPAFEGLGRSFEEGEISTATITDLGERYVTTLTRVSLDGSPYTGLRGRGLKRRMENDGCRQAQARTWRTSRLEGWQVQCTLEPDGEGGHTEYLLVHFFATEAWAWTVLVAAVDERWDAQKIYAEALFDGASFQ
ncbi:MAG: hypothetical protein QGG40_04090 [Myxococcota bacterium]|jgi:hypothetical protein|nr:hypothetical protein [Myxococcota bacterium]